MATAAQRRAYQRKLNELSNRYGRLEDETIQQMIAFLEEFRVQVAAELLAAAPDSFSAHRLQEMQRNIERLSGQLESGLSAAVRGSVEQAVALGGQSVVEPLRAAGLAAGFYQSSPQQINILLDFSADLIRDITAEMRQKINAQIRQAALGGRSPFQTMKAVTDILGIKGGRQVVKGVAARAESIVRTELGRAFNLSTHSQQQATAQQAPGLMKRWMATGDGRTRNGHLAAHGQTVEIGKPFLVGGEKLQYPLDPAGSARNTVRCRCRLVTVHPDMEKVETPVDGQVEKEKERRAAA